MSTVIKGRVWKFGDGISTDHIAPGRYFHLRSNLPELAKHVLEDADPEFPSKVREGDIVVGGKNFGQGSSREHAAIVIKLAGVSAVLAKSFARIFYRNAINAGLPTVICNTDPIEQGDTLEIDLTAGLVRDVTKGLDFKVKPLPEVMIKILKEGGLMEFVKRRKDLRF